MNNKKQILIIDDNVDITDMMSKYLNVKECDCKFSNNGKEGLEMIKTGSFDYVFLDLSMPEFGGQEVIQDLEKNDMLKSQKIIVFTASSISDEEIKELENKDGIIQCLRKPVQLTQITKIIGVE